MSIKVKREKNAFIWEKRTKLVDSPAHSLGPPHNTHPPTFVGGWVFFWELPQVEQSTGPHCHICEIMRFREAPFRLVPPLCGHCPNSNYTPPPRTQTGPLGHFFSGAILPFHHFYHFSYHFFTIFSE